MPHTAGLLAVAGAAGVLAALLLAVGLACRRGGREMTKPVRALLLCAAVCALCAVALAAVAGTLVAGADLGWF